MDDLLRDRIVQRDRAEARYLRGYRCMNMERFREYQREFRAAFERADYRKAGEVVQDSIQISRETMRLIRKRMAISARHSFLHALDVVPCPDGSIPLAGTPAPATPQSRFPANVTPLQSNPPDRLSPPAVPPDAGGAGAAGTS